MNFETLGKTMNRFKTDKGESFDDLAFKKLGRKVRMSDIQSYGVNTSIASDKHTVNIWLKANTGVPNRTTFKYEVKNRNKYLELDDALNEAYQNEDDDDLDSIELSPQPKQETVSSLVAEDDELPEFMS